MICAALMALYLGSALSACGKRGDPEPPPGAKERDFPRPYPDPKSY
jgi:predicted small lipoprotein YifL